jgi:hypothetical protein
MDVTPFLIRLAGGFGESPTQASVQIKQNRCSTYGVGAACVAKMIQRALDRGAPGASCCKLPVTHL